MVIYFQALDGDRSEIVSIKGAIYAVNKNWIENCLLFYLRSVTPMIYTRT
jgi:hypothetical protein